MCTLYDGNAGCSDSDRWVKGPTDPLDAAPDRICRHGRSYSHGDCNDARFDVHDKKNERRNIRDFSEFGGEDTNSPLQTL